MTEGDGILGCNDNKCIVCGKNKEDDKHFNIKRQLCNRHYLQFLNHGKFLDNELIINPNRVYWSDEEKQKLKELYEQNMKVENICKILNKSKNSISSMCSQLHLAEIYMKKNNANYKAVYQEYDWCFDRFIIQGMNHQEMADELGVSKRVIQKWCVEKHHIDSHTYKELKKLSDIQKQLIIAGTLGDGHIDKRPTQPMYIESHAIDEKDYLFWKYEILKDICNKEPVYYEESYTNFSSDKYYKCKPYYRINTRIINDLIPIRQMSRIDKIKQLNKFQFSLLMLDDGSRSNLWQLCVAEWSDNEVEALSNKCLEFELRFNRNKDNRYINFDALSSKRIDNIILEHIPNNLDIIKKKIINNTKVRDFKNSRYVICENKKIGLARYCKDHHISYENIKDNVSEITSIFNEIKEVDLLNLLGDVKNAI